MWEEENSWDKLWWDVTQKKAQFGNAGESKKLEALEFRVCPSFSLSARREGNNH